MKYVWVVEFLAYDTPMLVSVHANEDSAIAAVAAYGDTQSDYWVRVFWVHPVKSTEVEDEDK